MEKTEYGACFIIQKQAHPVKCARPKNLKTYAYFLILTLFTAEN